MPKGHQPLPDRTPKRESARLRQQRHRARKKVEAVERVEQERAHREFLWQQRLDNLIPVYLRVDLRFDDGRVGYSIDRGTRAWLVPGDVDWWIRKGLAVEAEAERVTGVRVIPSTCTPAIEHEEPEHPKERLPSGY